MIYLYTVGLSLSGKTWLVEKIKEAFPNKFAVIKSRSIHDMLNSMQPFKDDNSVDGESYEMRGEFTKEIRMLLIELFAKEGIDIIQDSCNLKKEERLRRVEGVKGIVPQVKTVLIYVDTDQEIVKERAKKEDDKNGNTIWMELFNKQIDEIEVPESSDANHFIHYDGSNWSEVIEEISRMVEDGV